MVRKKTNQSGKKFFVILSVVAILSAISIALVSAATSSGTRISVGTMQFVSSTGTCIALDNGCGNAIFVGKSSGEQGSFTNHFPSCVSVTSCGSGSAPSTQTQTSSDVTQAVIASLDATAAAGGGMMSSPTGAPQGETAPLGIIGSDGNTYYGGSSSDSSTSSDTSGGMMSSPTGGPQGETASLGIIGSDGNTYSGGSSN